MTSVHALIWMAALALTAGITRESIHHSGFGPIEVVLLAGIVAAGAVDATLI